PPRAGGPDSAGNAPKPGRPPAEGPEDCSPASPSACKGVIKQAMPRFIEGNLVAPKGRFALCVSRFNSFITEELVRGAVDALVRHGVSDDDIDVYRVPGAFELAGLARRVADSGKY